MNLEAKAADLEEANATGLANESIDWVLMVNVLFQTHKKVQVLGEVLSILKPSGRLLVIDWLPIFFALRAIEYRHKDLKQLAQKFKLKVVRELIAGQYHYSIIFEK